MTSVPLHAGRTCSQALNASHATVYFSPAPGQELAPFGIEHDRAVYFAMRAAPLGAVGAGTVTATFYNFSHSVVSRHVPDVWEFASPETVLAARVRAVDTVMRQQLGEETIASAQMAEAAELALHAAEGCVREGRPLYAGNADLPVPEAPHLAYWHAATLLREHRGDAHIVALQAAPLGPLESLVIHSATGQGQARGWLLRTRDYTEDDWAAAQDRLRERGLLDADHKITESGTALREQVEDRTDQLSHSPYEHLGADGAARLTKLAQGFVGKAYAAGAFPDDLNAKR